MPFASFSYYSSAAPVVASSSGANLHFGIRARAIHLQNLSAGDLWVKFSATLPGSTSIATSAELHLGTCTDHRMNHFQFDRSMTPIALSFYATSTAGTGHRSVAVFGEA